MTGDSRIVPLVDLRAQYESIRHEVDPAVLRVLGSGSYVQAGEVRQFEDEFAAPFVFPLSLIRAFDDTGVNHDENLSPTLTVDEAKELVNLIFDHSNPIFL